MMDPVQAREAKASRAQAMAAHVIALADQHGIDVEEYTGGGRAFPTMRAIRIRPVKGASSYFVALHEIGHVIGRGRSAPKLEQEANAWQWALDNARWPPTPGVRTGIARRLRGYWERHVRMSARRRVRWPPAGHPFYALARIEPTFGKYDDGRTAPVRWRLTA